MNALDRRVVVVTGAGRGIGRAVAQAAARAGAAIAVCDLGDGVARAVVDDDLSEAHRGVREGTLGRRERLT